MFTPAVASAKTLKELVEEAKKLSPEGKKHLEIWRNFLAKKEATKKGISYAEATASFSDAKVIAKMAAAQKRNPKMKVLELKATVIAAPNYETATRWGNHYFKKVGEYAVSKGVPVAVLDGPQDNPTNFHSQIRDVLNASYICGVGHGDYYIFTGQDSQPLLLLGDLQTKLTSQNRIFHLLSCVVGKQLGKVMVDSYKAKAFIGYKETYIFAIDEGAFPDSLATWFFEADNEVDRAMLEGNNCGDAFQRSRVLYEKGIAEAPGECQPYLQWDLDNFVLFGDPLATIDFVPPPPTTPPPGKKKANLGPLCRFKSWVLEGLTGRPH